MAIVRSFRVLITVTTALLLATLIASSTAHGLALGDAIAQSALGSPLRVVIPIAAAPGVSLQPGCFRFVPAAGDASAAMVTARVSLERAASAPRLLVTTQNSVNEPAIRFSIQAGCDGVTQRDYVLLLDPPVLAASTAAAATPAAARESGQERPVVRAATARGSGSAAMAETHVVHLPGLAEQQATSTLAAPEPSPPVQAATAGAIAPTALRREAALPASAAVAAPSPRAQPAAVGGTRLWILVAAALAGAGLIALCVLLARRRYAQPEVPQWTHSPLATGPRTFADLSTAPVTLPNTFSYAGSTTQAATTSPHRAQEKPATVAPRGGNGSPRGHPRHAVVDPSTIDTLLDEVDPDLVEERAVRKAWAAARSDVEHEMDGNAILQAIEEAERDLHLASPAQGQSAIERALDDDLLQPPRPR